jgi:hypothetical protein
MTNKTVASWNFDALPEIGIIAIAHVSRDATWTQHACSRFLPHNRKNRSETINYFHLHSSINIR